ncbi:MAG TPA: hypothetical protein VE733_00025, partial [Streptosporangiaceae bacterium]|nr:hypothetical protein [Streptosporangiaceae bacterium]
LDEWWQAAPAARPVAGRGLGARTGPAGQEFVIADGHGGECWLAGAGCGGVAGLMAASATPGRLEGPPWALLLYDRGEQILAGLRGADWVNGPAAMETLSLAAGRLGMSVTAASSAPRAMMASRDRAQASVTTADPWLSLAASRYSALVATVVALVAVIHGPPPAWYAFGGWAAALIAGLYLARWRAVL